MNKMMKMFTFGAIAILPALAAADWQVAESSMVRYVSVKNSTMAENNTISGVSGSLSEGGALTIELDLTTVETGVSIRNERMQQILFEVFDFGAAKVSGNLSTEQVAALTDGQTVRASMPLTLSLHGMEKPVTGEFLAVPTDAGVIVTSVAPILVNAGDFGLEEGVAALQQLAGLNAISRAVPVTVDLLLTPES